MQDEINTKVVALSIRTGSATAKVTARVLKQAMQKFLVELEKAQKAGKNVTRHGKQTIAQLMKQNTGLTNIEVTNQNIKSFERVAHKYNIDFALKKDKSASPPRYLVFFKGRDVDVMTAAFKEFSAKEVTKTKKPSIHQILLKYQEMLKAQNRLRQRVKTKDRGQER